MAQASRIPTAIPDLAELHRHQSSPEGMIAAHVVDLVSTVAELEKLAPAHFRLSLPIFISSTVNSGAGAPCGRAHPRVIKSEGRSK